MMEAYELMTLAKTHSRSPSALRALTRSQQAFVRAYTTDPSPSRAAREAGYSNPNYGYSLINKPHIQRALAQMEHGGIASDELSALKQRVVDELTAIAFSDSRDLFEEVSTVNNNSQATTTLKLKQPSDWSKGSAKAISRLRFYPVEKGGGLMEIALWPKGDAIKQLRQLVDDAERINPGSPIAVAPIIRKFKGP